MCVIVGAFELMKTFMKSNTMKFNFLKVYRKIFFQNQKYFNKNFESYIRFQKFKLKYLIILIIKIYCHN